MQHPYHLHTVNSHSPLKHNQAHMAANQISSEKFPHFVVNIWNLIVSMHWDGALAYAPYDYSASVLTTNGVS